MRTTPIDNRLPVVNPSRAEIESHLTALAPFVERDRGVYALEGVYDRSAVLARLRGDDLHAITDSAASEAASCARAAKMFFIWSIPTWMAGMACLLALGQLTPGIVVLAIGTLGIARGVRKMNRANEDRLLMRELTRLFAAPCD